MVLLFAAVILVITLIAGYLPFLMNRNPEHMHFLIAFSAGVMLGVLFIMLPPEALERTLDAGHSLHTAFYMILVGFVLLLFIDFMVKKYLHSDEHADDEHSHSITSMSAWSNGTSSPASRLRWFASCFFRSNHVGWWSRPCT